MSLKGTLSDTEHIGSVAADNLAHGSTAVAGSSNDFLYRNAGGGEPTDRRIHVLAPHITVILQPFSAGE
ncbi:hypothetical protein RvVAR0630_34120 [Agrobacterium vitis]|nr:hypothetical protein RvVAR0630_34120 [Agrobacterium vitis]